MRKSWMFFVVLSIIVASFTSCLTSKSLDKFVAAEYNNELPKPDKKKKVNISSASPTDNTAISTTIHTTNKFLPLIIYWQYDHRQTCSLNTAIPVTTFTNIVNSNSTKGLVQKLNGQKLELTVEQAPSAFSIVANERVIWLLYAITWAKIYIEPDFKDLVVSYKLVQDDKPVKTGRITIKNTDKNKGIRFFQSWRSATSEYLSDYNASVTAMTKLFVTQLTQEL